MCGYTPQLAAAVWVGHGHPVEQLYGQIDIRKLLVAERSAPPFAVVID